MSTEPSMLFVVGLGVATVFIGLICIIILCKILSAVCRLGEGKSDNPSPAPAATPVPVAVAEEKIENRQEIIAAVSAVIAEELGKDISAIRILSFKKI